MLQTAIRTLGYISLAAALAAPLAYATGALELAACKGAMLVATFLWFAASGARLIGSASPADSPSGS